MSTGLAGTRPGRSVGGRRGLGRVSLGRKADEARFLEAVLGCDEKQTGERNGFVMFIGEPVSTREPVRARESPWEPVNARQDNGTW